MSALFNIGNKIAVSNQRITRLPIIPSTGYSTGDLSIENYGSPTITVVRDFDSTERDFTGFEVFDGTLKNWVNLNETIYTSDFTLDADVFVNNVNVTTTANQTIDGESGALKVIVGSVNTQQAYLRDSNMFEKFNKYILTCKVYIPSGNSNVSGLSIYTGYGTDVDGNYIFTNTDTWINVSITFIPGAGTNSGVSLSFYARNNNGSLTLPSSAAGDVFYVKDVKVTRIGSEAIVKNWYNQFDDIDITGSDVAIMPKIISFGDFLGGDEIPALDFDGVDDELTITGVGISSWDEPFTMEVWVYIPTGASWTTSSYISGIFSSKGSFGGTYGFGKFESDTVQKIRFQVRTDSSNFNANSNNSEDIARDTWHNFVGVWTGTSAYLYHNGELESGPVTGTVGGVPDSTNLQIGYNVELGGGRGLYFEGQIAIANYFKKALTAQEVERNYKATKDIFGL